MKAQIKRALALILALIVCLSLIACGSAPVEQGGSTPAESGAGTTAGEVTPATEDKYIKFVMAGPIDPGNYLPFNADNSTRSTYSLFFYENLFELFDTTQLSPKLAKGYERVSEGVYEVYLRENIYDHAGVHLTADDVAFCFNRSLEIGERNSILGEIKSVTALDDYTVEFVFEPDMLGTFERVMTTTPIVTRESYEASATGFSSDPVGTGPYYISEWLPGASITFVKDENYWGKDEGFNNQNCDEIEVQFIAEPAQVAIGLETGALDFANVSSKDADSFVDRDGFEITYVPYAQVSGIGFNCDESCVFSDVRLRQAVCYAIDNEGILQSVYNGKGGVATCLAVPEPEGGLIIDFVPEWKNMRPYEYNLEKAKELMAEAGYPDGGLKVKLMAKDTDEYRSSCQVIQANLAQIGIEVEILCYENALYQTYRYQPDAFDLHIIGISNDRVPYIPIGWKWYVGRRTDTGKNVLFMDDDKMEELVIAALGFDTHGDESLSALQDYILETACMYPYVYNYNSFVHVDTISDIVMMGGVYFYPNMCTFSDDFVSHK